MSEVRRNAGVWPWIATVVLALPILYVASFGPASWYANGHAEVMPAFKTFYWPVGWTAVNSPARLNRMIRKYATYGCPDNHMNSMPIGPSGDAIVP